MNHFQVQELNSPPRPSVVVKDCVNNCVCYTYNFLFANCDEVYKQANITENNNEKNENGNQPSTTIISVIGPSLESLQFWHNFMCLLTCIISEDRKIYSSVLNQ